MYVCHLVLQNKGREGLPFFDLPLSRCKGMVHLLRREGGVSLISRRDLFQRGGGNVPLSFEKKRMEGVSLKGPKEG